MCELKQICVFCISSAGTRREYREAAREMGTLLALRRIGLVFGGGNRGLMGEVEFSTEGTQSTASVLADSKVS